MSSSDQPTDKPLTEVEPESVETSAPPAKKPVKDSEPKSRSWLFVLFIILLLFCSAGAYFLWNQVQTSIDELSSNAKSTNNRLSALSSKSNETRESINRHGDDLSKIVKLIRQQEQVINNLQQTQQTLIKTSQNVFNKTHRDQAQWLLSEVSYLLSLANQRLIVSRDIRTAIAALKAANNRLHDLADPSLLHLRKKIANETSQLSLLKLPDINGIALSLDNMTAGLEQLPFKTAQQKHIESTQRSEKIEIAALEDSGVLTPLWERVKSLVTIKKHHRSIQETKTPVQKSDIDNQLRYRLETSRLALINKNTGVFQNEIKNAIELLATYYDKNDNRVTALQTELTAFSTTNLLPVLPDITGSWIILQKIIAVNNAGNTLKVKKGKSIQ